MKSQYNVGHNSERLGIPPVGNVHGNVGCIKYSCSVSDFGNGLVPNTNGIAEGLLVMVRCADFFRSKALWPVPSGVDWLSSSSHCARCNSSGRRGRMISRTQGPPVPFMRMISYQAHLTVNQKPIREANSKNWRLPREKHFASFISHGPVSWIAPPVRGQTSSQIGFAPRLFPNSHQRIIRTLPVITVPPGA